MAVDETRATRAARTKGGKPRAGKDALAIIRAGGADETRIDVERSAFLRAAAMRWTYALRNRKRWTRRGRVAQTQREDASKLASDLGLSVERLRALAEADVVEVSMPYQGEAQGWEARIFPWEHVIASATRAARMGGERDFTIVRHLARAARVDAEQKPSLLYVEAAPAQGPFASWSFAGERALVEAAAKDAGLAYVQLLRPSEAKLAEEVRKHRPRVVHVAGFDVHQARRIAGKSGDEAEGIALDGCVLSDGRDGYVEVPALRLAKALTADGTAPALVCWNLHNSAPRIAALCVAEGAQASVGFQDSFDDTLGEVFFGALYRAFGLLQQSVHDAFAYAWKHTREQGRRMTGSGVVLWSATSAYARRAKGQQAPMSAKDVEAMVREHSQEPVTVASARADLKVEIVPVPELNYSVLHNDGPLFSRFKLEKTRSSIGAIEGIDVSVLLHVGQDSYPYRKQVALGATQRHEDIADRIRISLASSLARGVRERLHTNLFVEVAYQGITLYRETHRVTLLPVDEWHDTDAHRKWLPSFVLPRDPAVLRVIDLAQRYLQALADDPTAGFDGYQSVEVLEKKPLKLDCTGVDLQVQAIWAALLYETPLHYINPPPTFTESSQRLRSPSEVIDGHRGTCIDLALLLASCLEYVEIYPTIILLSDHAFPCYWRAEQHYDAFAAMRAVPMANGASPELGAGGGGQSDGWCYLKAHFREVLAEITAGRLVPLEATGLCFRDSFASAREQGLGNLSRKSRFDSMLDVRAARDDEETPVTPLPLLRTEV